jgi:hypothetical protein
MWAVAPKEKKSLVYGRWVLVKTLMNVWVSYKRLNFLTS